MKSEFHALLLFFLLLIFSPVSAHPGHGDHQAGMAALFHGLTGLLFLVGMGVALILLFYAARQFISAKSRRWNDVRSEETEG